mmetsp:Transcript_16780/g.65539  ORF Transcript_16780/g.65539 Transcript_16780/m.65539 type:complete len:250 (-) Transcript_16780:301-1050(-)
MLEENEQRRMQRLIHIHPEHPQVLAVHQRYPVHQHRVLHHLVHCVPHQGGVEEDPVADGVGVKEGDGPADEGAVVEDDAGGGEEVGGSGRLGLLFDTALLGHLLELAPPQHGRQVVECAGLFLQADLLCKEALSCSAAAAVAVELCGGGVYHAQQLAQARARLKTHRHHVLDAALKDAFEQPYPLLHLRLVDRRQVVTAHQHHRHRAGPHCTLLRLVEHGVVAALLLVDEEVALDGVDPGGYVVEYVVW